MTRTVNHAHPEVQGHCPACGLETLFVGAGGYLTCSYVDCPLPDAASRLLERVETAHIVQLTAHSWTAEHPLIERITGSLLSCGIGEAVDHQLEFAEGVSISIRPGRYRVVLQEDGSEWVRIGD